jgi:hypothetical protein
VLVGKTERKSLFGKPKRRWEDEIEMNLKLRFEQKLRQSLYRAGKPLRVPGD